MSYYGSNYPPTNAYGGGGGFGGAYPSNSGPPMPGGGGYSAYNVNQYPGGYGGGGYGGAPQPYQGGAYAAAGGGYGQPGAVPGFTAPAIQQCQQQYGGGGGAPRMPPPASMQYNQMHHQMAAASLQQTQYLIAQQMGIVDVDEEEEEEMRRLRKKKRRRARRFDDDEEEEDEDLEEERRKAEERIKRAEEKARQLQEKLANNDDLKAQLREKFVAELMRRQTVSGTFEETHGTVFPFESYEEGDPVATWFQSEKGQDILGESWDPLYDCEFLRDGMKGLGTNEQAIIDIVSTRSGAQRHTLLKDFKTSYGRDLIKDLKSELSGDFKESILACFESPARYDAWACKKAIYGLGTDEASLIEILLTRTNAQINEMVSEYNMITYEKQRDPESSLEKDIEGDTSGDFKRLLISAAQGNRRLIQENKLSDAVEEVMHNGTWTGMFRVNYEKLCQLEKCKRMAKELYEAGEDKWGTDEETFNRIFSTQDYYTLRVVWDEYVKISQRDILNSVDRETSGNFKKGLCALAQNIKCRPMFFAEKLYKAMKGLGTDDSTLIRIVVSRSEIDMVQIKACFLEKYHQTLWNFIKDDTSGDYRKLLCGIVGKN